MPTARADNYSIPSGADFYAGLFGPPSWLSGVVSGQSVQLPNSTLTSSGAGWTGTAPGGTGNYQTIVTAWGGGCLNTVGVKHGGTFIPGTFLVIFGGGHGDYGGNEVMAYGPLESNSPIWRRLTDPTIPAPVNVIRDGSGNPVSRHTYDSLMYLPGSNKMLAVGAAGYYSVGFAFNGADLFDFATNTWSNVDAGFPAYTGGGTISMVGGVDETTGKVWGVGNGNASKLCSFDPSSSTWSSWYKDNPNGPTSGKGAVGRGLLVQMKAAVVYAQDLSAPNSVFFTPTVTGTAPAASGIEGQTLEWDSIGGYFFTVSSTGYLFKLTPGASPLTDAWSWSSVAISGSAPAAGSANGVYGRLRSFQGNASLPRGVVYMPAQNAPICFIKA